MLNSMMHRGPDAEGVFGEGRVLLGHRRLSIIDTSAAANQPMGYKDYVIVFNGEIYNYLEIRQELQQRGHHFTTQSDTEVLLHAYEEWGEDCLVKLCGMWAFGILDKQKQRLFLSRDRFGIKPLYYSDGFEKFVFASEIKAIIAIGMRPQVNWDVLLPYLVVGLDDFSAETFFHNIKQLLPAQKGILDLTTGEWRLETYYNLPSQEHNSIGISRYAELLQDSVRLHLRSDVPVGTCLSGGLDSSTVAALAAKGIKSFGGNSKFLAVTAQSEEDTTDESRYASQVIKFCGLDWRLIKPTYEDLNRDIERCLYIQDEPVGGPSVFMQYAVMQAAQEAGLKVMLDGQGGDETLLGYERYYPYYLLERFLRKQYLDCIKEYFLAVRHSKLTHFLLFAYSLYFLSSAVRRQVVRRRCRFLRAESRQHALDVLLEWLPACKRLEDLQLSEIRAYQLPHLLRYEDRNSMAHSIEARVPFLDHRCVEGALSLQPEEKIKDGYTKYALRKLAATILPASIAWRREKLGFEAPERLWFKNHYGKMQREVRQSHLLRSICSRIPDLHEVSRDIAWRLYNIAVWERLYNIAD
jgi:asparagine synthase (glutamine-hydrolysing)